mmetsp:Transcript_9377/g.24256  ORF Transcript_9377/g.24256 Transcript_9377/m.24256 type:complete len:82 (-) Transcript_9377:370-615(-)|eukprot:CAMPEP_0119408420 /NCGR_PEP_ID=MMETSP1335-20130426/1976_1 /TAXON_ID=259385 /ORGANISM="Chrysoculter rhomboideus, Strain RCC1486" /LENGTH=81 /DNA_ID=CAMNT_0007432653 /DNA_START=152 /DNA_END=397 /DNA_ORIENTATION=-
MSSKVLSIVAAGVAAGTAAIYFNSGGAEVAQQAPKLVYRLSEAMKTDERYASKAPLNGFPDTHSKLPDAMSEATREVCSYN